MYTLVDQQFGYVCLLLDLARIITELFLGRSLLNFVSTIRYRALLLCRAGYTLGYATHFDSGFII